MTCPRGLSSRMREASASTCAGFLWLRIRYAKVGPESSGSNSTSLRSPHLLYTLSCWSRGGRGPLVDFLVNCRHEVGVAHWDELWGESAPGWT